MHWILVCGSYRQVTKKAAKTLSYQPCIIWLLSPSSSLSLLQPRWPLSSSPDRPWSLPPWDLCVSYSFLLGLSSVTFMVGSQYRYPLQLMPTHPSSLTSWLPKGIFPRSSRLDRLSPRVLTEPCYFPSQNLLQCKITQIVIIDYCLLSPLDWKLQDSRSVSVSAYHYLPRIPAQCLAYRNCLINSYEWN